MVKLLSMKRDSKKKQRTSTYFSILFDIAVNGPKSMWELASRLNKSYGNIHDTVKKLTKEKEKMIEPIRTEPSSKNPKIQVEYYDINIWGLFFILQHEKILEYIDEIAARQKDKLIIFEKWDFFKERGVEKNLKFAIGRIGEILSLWGRLVTKFPTPWLNPNSIWTEVGTCEFIEDLIIGAYTWENVALTITTEPGALKLYFPIWRACMDDPKLKEWLLKKFDKTKGVYQQILKMISSLEEKLRKVESEKESS